MKLTINNLTHFHLSNPMIKSAVSIDIIITIFLNNSTNEIKIFKR